LVNFKKEMNMQRSIFRILQKPTVTILCLLILSCEGLFGPHDDEKDPNSSNYQGFNTVLSADEISTYSPDNDAKLRVMPEKFVISEVEGAEVYSIQISTSSSFNTLSFEKNDYTSNQMTSGLPVLAQGQWYYWRAQAKKNGVWGSWTQASSFFLGYAIKYDGNGSTSGSVLLDSNGYLTDDTITVLGNTGNLVKTGYTFAGWNTTSDGTGTSYAAGATFTMGSSNVTLYAKWTVLTSIYTVIYDGNGATGGSVPIDSNSYVEGATVTILGNTGNLVKTGYTFAGWNTTSDGTGTSYAAGATFTMGSSNITLYAMWNALAADVEVGRYHTLIVKTDGSLWGTGLNYDGQLGDGTNVDKELPVFIMSNVKVVSAGAFHTLILKTDGTLWAAGGNSNGQLGDGTNISRNSPVKIMTGVQSMSAGYKHTMILKTDGTLWATGLNSDGQLGNGSTINKNLPVKIMTGVQSVSSGYMHTMVLKMDGTLWATGDNTCGQLGDGTTLSKDTPVQIMTGVKAVSAGALHTMILKTSGELLATGDNSEGQYGNGNTSSSISPITVGASVEAVSAGDLYTMILKTNGALWATGSNGSGQLGDGTMTDRCTLVQIMTDVSTVEAGVSHTMIVKNDSTLWGTGNNEYGQLGDGTTISKSTPLRIM